MKDKFINEEGFNANALMAPDKIVDAAIKGLQKNQEEIFPGFAKVARLLSLIAPKFLLAQTGKMGASFMYGQK